MTNPDTAPNDGSQAAAITPDQHNRPASEASPPWFYSFIPNKLGLGATLNLPPLYITEVLGGSVADLGIASALTSAATVPAAALWGWLSDRYGTRKLYIILGYLGLSIPTILMALCTNVWQFFALAVLLGAWSVAGAPVSSTLIMDTTPKEHWEDAFGRFNTISGWGIVAGRVVGLATIFYGIDLIGNANTQRGLWLISGGLSLLSVMWGWSTVPIPGAPKPRPPRQTAPDLSRFVGFPLVERARYIPHAIYHLPVWHPREFVRILAQGLSHVPDQLQATMRGGIALLHNPLIAYYLASFLLFTMSVMAYTPFPVWQRQELFNSGASVFLIGMINSIASTLTYRRMGTLIKRYGSIRVQMATISLRILVFGGFAVISLLGLRGWQSMAVLIVLQTLSGFGWAGIAVAGNTTIAHLAPKGSEGVAVGAYTSFVSIGSIVGALISGYLVLWLDYAVVFAAGAAGVGLTVYLLWLIRRNASDEVKVHL